MKMGFWKLIYYVSDVGITSSFDAYYIFKYIMYHSNNRNTTVDLAKSKQKCHAM